MNSFYLEAIKKFEGFAQRAEWDYAQHTNGYGTRALFPGEVIDRAEAERRFRAEISEARAIVERNAPNADEGTKAALTSLTFNAGDKWTRSGLGEAIRQGDTQTARDLFLQYNKAGGQTLPGLVARRLAEAEWFGNPAIAALDAPVSATRSAADNLSIANSVDLAATRSVEAGSQEGRDRASELLFHATVDRPVGTISVAAHTPEQRFAQEASALLMLMQLETLPLLPNRPETRDDRNEHRKPAQEGSIVPRKSVLV